MKKLLIILILLAVICGGACGAYAYMTSAVTLDGETPVTVAESSTSDTIAAQLKDEGVIRSAMAFKLKVRMDGVAPELKSGTYYFKDTNSLDDVIAALVKGPAVSGVKVTIPEGYNQSQIIAALADAGVCSESEFLEAAANGDFGYDYLPAAGDSLRLQGFLFPDTYYISPDDSAATIIGMMLKEFDGHFSDEWKARLNERGQSVHDWVTMASIIEKEAVVSEDRPIISGVFYNRLAQNMNLQSCATVQYALGEVKPVLSNEDVQIASPYNTYTNPGLPPGPIASPGLESLEAALYPAATDCLFFVAKPNGAHIFSVTYDEHLKAKADIENGLYNNE